MQRSLLSISSLALLLISTQAFSADKPADSKLLTSRPAVVQPAPQKPATPASAPAAPAPAPTTKLSSATYNLAEVKALEEVIITFAGVNLPAGKSCYGKIVWSDGSTYDNTLAVNGAWRTLPKTFGAAGLIKATVTPKSYSGEPCTSDAPITMSINVTAAAPLPPSSITKLVVSPKANPKDKLISVVWTGNGNKKEACYVKLDFGDGTSMKTIVGAVQPGFEQSHTYPAAADYIVSITALQPEYYSCAIGTAAAPQPVTVQ
jgi:hypothetical protein